MHPQSMDEYSKRVHENMHVEGFGADVRTYFPCPFCAARDWLCCRIVSTEEDMKRGATCKRCGRSAKAVFVLNEPDNKQFEIVQTGGDEAPAWLEPKMRRIDDASSALTSG